MLRSIEDGSICVQEDRKVDMEGTDRRSRIGSFGCRLQTRLADDEGGMENSRQNIYEFC